MKHRSIKTILTLCLLTPCAAGLGERHFEGSPWINPELIW